MQEKVIEQKTSAITNYCNLRSQTIYGGLVETLGPIPWIIRISINLYFYNTLQCYCCQ